MTESERQNIEHKIEQIQKSTRTTFGFFVPWHDYFRMRSKWYYNWHLKSFINLIHVSIAIFFIVITGIFVYYNASSNQVSAGGPGPGPTNTPTGTLTIVITTTPTITVTVTPTTTVIATATAIQPTATQAIAATPTIRPRPANTPIVSSGQPSPNVTPSVELSAPHDVSVTVISLSEVLISWLPPSDQSSQISYQVFRNDQLIGVTTSLSYLDKNLSRTQDYHYYIVAVDAAGNQSSKSQPVIVDANLLTISQRQHDMSMLHNWLMLVFCLGVVLAICSVIFSQRNQPKSKFGWLELLNLSAIMVLAFSIALSLVVLVVGLNWCVIYTAIAIIMLIGVVIYRAKPTVKTEKGDNLDDEK